MAFARAAVVVLLFGLSSACGASAPADGAGPSAPTAADCEPLFAWVDCDDCDSQDLASRGLASQRAGCLARALRDGPGRARRAQYRTHGQEEAWSLRHRQRAVYGLASLGAEGRAVLERARDWPLPVPVRSTLETTLLAARARRSD